MMKVKKMVARVLAVLLIFMNFGTCLPEVFTVTVRAEEYTAEADFAYTVANGEVTITGYTGADKTIVIPPTINEKAVVGIGESTFYENTNLESVSAPSVTNIGLNAFKGCKNMVNVSLSNATDIGVQAFWDCTSLTKLDLPKATSIGRNAFAYCTSLTELELPEATSIGFRAFEGCTSLTELDLPEVTSIGNEAFLYCTSLIKFSLPKATSIGSGAFYGCTSLNYFVIPESVTEIGNGAFDDNLILYCYADSVGETYAKQKGINYELTTTTYKDIVPLSTCTITLSSNAIYDGSEKKPEIVVKDGDKLLQEGTDYKVTCTNNINGGTANAKITGLQKYAGIENKTFTIFKQINQCTVILSQTRYAYDGKIKTPVVTVKDGSKTLVEDEDYTVSYPSSRTDIGNYTVTITGKGSYIDTTTASFDITQYTAEADFTYTEANGELTITGYKGTDKSIVIPPTIGGTAVVGIGMLAFYENTNLERVSAPSVTSIGSGAFSGCTSLSELELPLATSIGVSAFSGCTSLSELDLPLATSIDGEAFSGCTSLSELDLPKATSIGYKAFSGCTSLSELDLPLATSIGDKAFSGCTSLSELDLPLATSIGGSAFEGCTSLTELDLPLATSIGDSAFYRCTSLTELDLPLATSIGNSAFLGCTSLNDVVIPESVTEIGDYAFGYDCNENDEVDELIPDFTIYCYADSTGETYAKENNINYELIVPLSTCTITFSTAIYDGSKKEPAIVKDGDKTLVEGTDYKVTYTNNINAGTATATITAADGQYKYGGSQTKNFTISAKSFNPCTVTLSQTTYTYNGKAQAPTVTVKDGSKTLVENQDYTISYPTTRTNAGSYTITITGKNNYTGTQTKTYTITQAVQKIAAANKTKKTGDKAFALGAKGTAGGGALSYQSSNTKVCKVSTSGKVTIIGSGKATITITAKENTNYQKATKKITITVAPKKATVTKIKSPAKKEVAVTWKKDSTASGYEVQIATNKKFSAGKKSQTIKNNKTITKTFTGLKSGKTYYVRVCAYKTIDGKKVYGDWSALKSIKCK